MSNKEASSDDYQVMGTFKLPEKETSIAVELQTVEDMVVEGDETLIVFVALQVGTVLHSASPVTLTIRNDDEPTWVVTAAPSAIEEGGAGAATGRHVLHDQRQRVAVAPSALQPHPAGGGHSGHGHHRREQR